MGKVHQTRVNNFSGGLSEDKRSTDASRFSITKHFDTFTYPHKLVPYYQTEASLGLSAGDIEDLKIVKFVYAPFSTGYRLFGFGVVSGTTRIKVFTLDIDGTGNLDTENWVAATNGESSAGARSEDVFFYYKGFIYMWKGGTNLTRFDTATAIAFNETYQSISYSTVVQPVHHPSDDIAYFFSDNNVHTLNNTTWSSNVLVLPSNMTIVDACPYGNYLAIACVTAGSFPQSVVFLWDRDSSITTLTERIDFGEGTIVYIANLNSKLVAVMDLFSANSYGLTRGRVLVKQASGNLSVTLNTITMDVNQTSFYGHRTKVVQNDRLHFPMKATLNGDTRFGIWAVDENGKAALDFLESSATSYQGIYRTGNMWWIAHSADGSVSRTDDDSGYSSSNASVYETLIFTGDDSSRTKKLLNVIVTTEPLQTGAQIVLKYRKNEETSWTTIFTEDTDNEIQHEAINIESSGASFPHFKEIQFQVNSTGGAVLTGLVFTYEEIDDGLLTP